MAEANCTLCVTGKYQSGSGLKFLASFPVDYSFLSIDIRDDRLAPACFLLCGVFVTVHACTFLVAGASSSTLCTACNPGTYSGSAGSPDQE
jgi:hypothetical protein